MNKYEKEIAKINLILKEISKRAKEKGLAELLNNTDSMSVLRVAEYEVDDGFRGGYMLCARLFSFDRYETHYITWLTSEIKTVRAGFYAYESRESINECSAIISAKEYIRAYFRGEEKGYILGY